MTDLTVPQRLKFELLTYGVVVDESALSALRDLSSATSLTPHDYASTSGVILQLEDDVWVNAPIETYNPNFVTATPYRLRFDNGSFLVEGPRVAVRAAFWPQPMYHGTATAAGPANNYVVTHGDRARLSPVRSCSMTCVFCNIPYDDPLDVYTLKRVEDVLAATRIALDDELQPAQHLLVSGGTPKPKDVGWMRDLYASVLGAFPNVDVDIMMVPLPGLFDLPRLKALGVNQLSINLELFDAQLTKDYARQKYNQGRDFYLDFIARASAELGTGSTRSMLMVGLEPMEQTLDGVRAIAERGGTPVLSPFRPDPATPLSDHEPPTSAFLIETYLRAVDVASGLGASLGPDCPPCTHNTLNFAVGTHGTCAYQHPLPTMVGAAPC